jgi:transposase
MAVADAHGLPIAINVTSASPNEVILVHDTLARGLLAKPPQRLIGDRAYDCDRLDGELAKKKIELIAPHRCNKKIPTQDGRVLRRYKRRWHVERFFAWLKNFRRIALRWDIKLENYLGFVTLGCITLILKRYL